MGKARFLRHSNEIRERARVHLPHHPTAVGLIDRANQIVRATEPRFSHRSSPISTSVEENGRLMLAGFQAGRAWSITYVEDTNEMSLAISDPDAAILVFGRCLTHEEMGAP